MGVGAAVVYVARALNAMQATVSSVNPNAMALSAEMTDVAAHVGHAPRGPSVRAEPARPVNPNAMALNAAMTPVEAIAMA